MMTPQERKAMRREQIRQYLATSLTFKEWCEANDLSVSTMRNWMAKFRKEEPELFENSNSEGWIEVSRTSLANLSNATSVAHPQIDVYPQGSQNTLTIQLNGAVIAVPKGTDTSHLLSVLQVVSTL